MDTDLKGMAEIVAGHIPKRIMIIPIGNWKHVETDLYLEVYNGLLDGLTPDGKQQKYFGHQPGSAGFRSLKSRIKTCLLNMLYLVDFSRSPMSEALKAELECLRLGFLQRLLTAFYLRNEGMEINKKIYRIAEQFKLAAPLLLCLATLRKEASETGNIAELENLIDESSKWQEYQAAESRAKGYYELIEVQFALSISQKPWLAEKAFASAKLVKKDLERYDSPVLEYEKYRILYAGHHCAKDYKKAIADMEALEDYYAKHPQFAGSTRYAEIALRKLNCYMHLKDYAAGLACAQACLASFWIGSSNRIFFMEVYFMFAMQAAEYDESIKIINNAKSESGFHKLDETHKKKWQLYKIYYDYVTDTLSGEKSFNLKKFLGDYGNLADDKSGYNAAVYIMGWCLQLRYGEPAELTGKAEAFKKYRARYLKEIEDHRINIFLSLMQAADRLDYNYKNVLEQTTDLIKELQSTPLAESIGNFEGVEIIPLETLWNMAMEDMK